MHIVLNSSWAWSVAAGVTLVCSLALTAAVAQVMPRFGIVDRPTARKQHARPVAYMGGLAMALALLVGISVGVALQPLTADEASIWYALAVGTVMTTALGAADDLLDLRPVPKLLGQLAIGATMWALSVRIDRLTGPGGNPLALPPVVSLAITTFWYALLMNGLNLVDGMDGLAAGIAAISAATLAALAADLDQSTALAAALLLFATSAGFLPLNRAPARVFMGDAGALLLGFWLATITLNSSTKGPATLTLAVPLLATGLPIFETTFAFLRRLAKGVNPLQGDRRHLHHRFLALGFTERRTVWTFYYLTASFGAAAYAAQDLPPHRTLILAGAVLVGLAILISHLQFLEERLSRGDSRADEDSAP